MSDDTRLLLELALRRLNPVEAWVIRERYGVAAGNPLESSPSYFHRSHMELARDCGLSSHRIKQIEETALSKLRDVLEIPSPA